jgi:hypothetical protein
LAEFTIAMKVLLLCTTNPFFIIEAMDESEHFTDKKLFLTTKKNPSVHRLQSAACRLLSFSKFCKPHNFFPFNLHTSRFQVKGFELNLSSIVF